MSREVYLLARVSKGIEIRDTGIVPAAPARESPHARLRRKRNRDAAASGALAAGGAGAFGGAGLMHLSGERKMWDAATDMHNFDPKGWDKGVRRVKRAGVVGRSGKLAMLASVPVAGAAGVRHVQMKRSQRG